MIFPLTIHPCEISHNSLSGKNASVNHKQMSKSIDNILKIIYKKYQAGLKEFLSVNV